MWAWLILYFVLSIVAMTILIRDFRKYGDVLLSDFLLGLILTLILFGWASIPLIVLFEKIWAKIRTLQINVNPVIFSSKNCYTGEEYNG